MTDVHPNPGYSNYEYGVRNALRNPGLLSSTQYRDATNLDHSAMNQLSNIKAWAKEVWSRPDCNQTTYQFQYPEKKLMERTRSAPTEELRKNKPHPPQVFLTNRLHYVPGYHNADADITKSHYQIDDSCGSDELSYRRGLRSKYIADLSDNAVRQYMPASNEDTDITKWNRTLPPNEAWMASSTNGAKPGSSRMIQSLDEAIKEAADTQANQLASHSRYLRLAGKEERERIQRALDARADGDKIPNMMVPYQTKGNLGTQRQKDRANFEAKPNKPLYRFPRPRGDFLIHPVWPPSMYHHRIPGFKPDPPARSSVSAYERHQRTRLNGIY